MSQDDRSKPEHGPTDSDLYRSQSPLSRRRALKGIAALGTGATVLGGAAGSASASSTPHEIVVERRSDFVRYRIEVSGEIEKGPEAGWNDEIRDGHVAVGELDAELTEDIDDRVDDFRFSGKVVDIEVLKGEAKFITKRKDQRKAVRRDEDGKKDKRHEITFHAQGPRVKYEFVVTGDVEAGSMSALGNGSYIEEGVIHGNVAGDGADNYHFTGDIEKFHVTDPDRVTVEIDGEEVDPLSLGEYGHIVIHAQGPHVKYEFTTTGEFEPGKESTVGTGSYIDNGTAYGNVAGQDGRDNYWFTGTLTSGEVDRDDVTVLVDGTEVDPHKIGK